MDPEEQAIDSIREILDNSTLYECERKQLENSVTTLINIMGRVYDDQL